jgi:hypothetical protein
LGEWTYRFKVSAESWGGLGDREPCACQPPSFENAVLKQPRRFVSWMELIASGLPSRSGQLILPEAGQVGWVERSETHRSPGKRDGFRFALPILQTFIVRPICPSGAIAKILSIAARKNISVLQKSDQVYGLPVPHRQGAYRDRHGRGAECGGRVGAVR